LGDRRSGFDLTTTTLQAYPNLVVVILLSHPSQTAVVKAFRAGARGVFSRERPIGDFLDCIEHVRRGYLWAGLRRQTCCFTSCGVSRHQA
jgi:DNA-binding NarL/FixJ family response regulator